MSRKILHRHCNLRICRTSYKDKRKEGRKKRRYSRNFFFLIRMGLLSEGQPLNWIEIKAVLEQIQNYAVDQLIRIYNKCKNRQGDAFTWGDEVYSIYRFSYLYFVSLLKLEFTLVRFDHANKKVRLLLKGHQLLPILIELNDKIDDE